MSFGRGRGRGKSNSSINVISENLGIARGDISGLTAQIQPKDTFPPLLRDPQPLLESEYHNYLIALKQEFRNYMRDSPYHIQPETEKSAIERYSDRFKQYNTHRELEWVPNWNMFPRELRMKTSKSAKKSSDIKPRMVGKRTDHSDATLLKRLDKLQEHEKHLNNDDKGSDDDFNNFEDEFENDDVEEDLDYVQNYHDDDYDAFDDEGDEGPTM